MDTDCKGFWFLVALTAEIAEHAELLPSPRINADERGLKTSVEFPVSSFQLTS
jgi:hypothetical protein